MKRGPTIEEGDEDDDEDDESKMTHRLYDVIEETLKAAAVFDPTSDQVLRAFPLDHEDSIYDSFQDDGPDEEKYEGYHGNWGCEATHWYRRTVRQRLHPYRRFAC
jgi:hypothetical protein